MSAICTISTHDCICCKFMSLNAIHAWQFCQFCIIWVSLEKILKDNLHLECRCLEHARWGTFSLKGLFTHSHGKGYPDHWCGIYKDRTSHCHHVSRGLSILASGTTLPMWEVFVEIVMKTWSIAHQMGPSRSRLMNEVPHDHLQVCKSRVLRKEIE